MRRLTHHEPSYQRIHHPSSCRPPYCLPNSRAVAALCSRRSVALHYCSSNQTRIRHPASRGDPYQRCLSSYWRLECSWLAQGVLRCQMWTGGRRSDWKVGLPMSLQSWCRQCSSYRRTAGMSSPPSLPQAASSRRTSSEYARNHVMDDARVTEDAPFPFPRSAAGWGGKRVESRQALVLRLRLVQARW